MIAARVIQGIGGGVLPLTFGIIRDEFPREKVAGAIGTSAALLAVGGGVGLVIAGPLVDALSYHWLFWIPMIMTDRGRDRGRASGSRSRRSARRAGSTSAPRCCCPPGWSRCCSPSARATTGAGAPPG